jgi:integrase
VVAVGAGLRRGELFGLQVGDIDLLRHTIAVERQVVLANNRPQVGPLKTRPSYRTIPVGHVVIDALAAHLAAFPAGPEGFVFARPAGDPCSPPRFTEAAWRPARRAAGVPAASLHDLRHFYASALIRAGLSVKAVSARLGHGNAAETLNTYSHLWPDDEDRTRQAIDDVLRRDVPPVRPEGAAGREFAQVRLDSMGDEPTCMEVTMTGGGAPAHALRAARTG